MQPLSRRGVALLATTATLGAGSLTTVAQASSAATTSNIAVKNGPLARPDGRTCSACSTSGILPLQAPRLLAGLSPACSASSSAPPTRPSSPRSSAIGLNAPQLTSAVTNLSTAGALDDLLGPMTAGQTGDLLAPLTGGTLTSTLGLLNTGQITGALATLNPTELSSVVDGLTALQTGQVLHALSAGDVSQLTAVITALTGVQLTDGLGTLSFVQLGDLLAPLSGPNLTSVLSALTSGGLTGNLSGAARRR